MPPARAPRTPYAVLAMLSLGPRSGYDIQRDLDFSVGHFWSESNGQLYPALKRLVARRLARSRATRGGRRRTVYAITRAGRAELTRWLAETPALPVARNEMLLKLFVGWHVPPKVAVRALSGFRARLACQLAQFASIERALMSERRAAPDVEFWLITIRAGRAVAGARLAWCDDAMTALTRMPDRERNATAGRSRVMGDALGRLAARLGEAPRAPRARRRTHA